MYAFPSRKKLSENRLELETADACFQLSKNKINGLELI